MMKTKDDEESVESAWTSPSVGWAYEIKHSVRNVKRNNTNFFMVLII